MRVNRDYRDLLSALNVAEARYLVIGAHAVTYYTSPRYTKDIDLWVEARPANLERVSQALAEFGAAVETATVLALAGEDAVLQIGVEPSRIDLLSQVSPLEFDSAWRRRVETTYGNVPISVLSLEDLIAVKEAAGRPQDLLDVERLRSVRPRAR
jgi:predicted nucleotidyltransferase